VADLHSQHGAFTIWRMQVQRETKKQYYIFDIETLFGTGGYYQDAVSKHAAHDNLNSAIKQVIDKLQDRIQSLRKQRERHIQKITELQAMLE
jgi:ribosome-associated translation inhibitor RaiA